MSDEHHELLPGQHQTQETKRQRNDDDNNDNDSNSFPSKKVRVDVSSTSSSTVNHNILEWNDEDVLQGISAIKNLDSSRMYERYTLPPELNGIDWEVDDISWNKYHPYRLDQPYPFVPIGTPPEFTPSSPTLCFQVNAICGRARACTMHCKMPSIKQNSPISPLMKKIKEDCDTASTTDNDNDDNEIELLIPSRPIPTPIFMPVGTKGTLKGITMNELCTDPALQCPIILANTYHLAIQPGTELVHEMNGLHHFQGLINILNSSDNSKKITNDNNNNNHDNYYSRWNNNNQDLLKEQNRLPPLSYNLLTDSGGYQMISLLHLSEVSEEGVSFENPYKQKPKTNQHNGEPTSHDIGNENILLLRPEDSIRHQNHIGSNIMMQLDDVISSVTDNEQRFVLSTHRTLRWYDRCYKYHHEGNSNNQNNNNNYSYQNLFPIVQGGLDITKGGLREQCLAGFRYREMDCHYNVPGYAIGGLAVGEAKDDFWKAIDLCCRSLPDNKPRYLMGVGYPLDLVICTALGVDMYDCVYPTRTARFGVALIHDTYPSTLRLSSEKCKMQYNAVIQKNCICQACRNNISRRRIYGLLKANNPLGVELITQHNISFMYSLVNDMRQSIINQTFPLYVKEFIKIQFPVQQDIPTWVIDALKAAGIDILTTSS